MHIKKCSQIDIWIDIIIDVRIYKDVWIDIWISTPRLFSIFLDRTSAPMNQIKPDTN